MAVSDHVALVTGGSRGIGRAITLELASHGIQVAFTYHSNHEAADTLCREVKELDGESIAFQQDVSDFEGAKSVLTAVKDRFGPVTILVNNAGITRDKPLGRGFVYHWAGIHD